MNKTRKRIVITIERDGSEITIERKNDGFLPSELLSILFIEIVKLASIITGDKDGEEDVLKDSQS